MEDEMEITPFLLVDAIQKKFSQELENDPDLKNGQFETERFINIFKKSSNLMIRWSSEEKPEPILLASMHIQKIPYEDKEELYAFKVSFTNKALEEVTLSLIKGHSYFENEANRLLSYLKAVTLLGLQKELPEGTTLQSKPEELLASLKKKAPTPENTSEEKQPAEAEA